MALDKNIKKAAFNKNLQASTQQQIKGQTNMICCNVPDTVGHIRLSHMSFSGFSLNDMSTKKKRT
jgi:hypothetical protein